MANWPKLSGKRSFWWKILGAKSRIFGQKMAKSPFSAHFYFEKWPQKTVDFQGFAGLLAKNPLIFHTTRRKKVNIYNNIAKKVGFWPRGDFSGFQQEKGRGPYNPHYEREERSLFLLLLGGKVYEQD